MNKITNKSFITMVLLSTFLLSGCGSQTTKTVPTVETKIELSLDSKLRTLATDADWVYKSYSVMQEKDTSIVTVINQDGRNRLYLYVIEDGNYLSQKELLVETLATQTITDIKAVSDGVFTFILKEDTQEKILQYNYKSKTVVVIEDETTEEEEKELVSESTSPVFEGEFSEIQEIFYNAKEGLIDDATFILIGDSTRAVSANNGQLLYATMQEKLQAYNFTENNNSFLKARGSHQLEQFNEDAPIMIRPTYTDVIALIPNDGANSIVDMSLGVNDFYHWHELYDFNTPTLTAEVTAVIEEKLKTAIDHILDAKPATKIYLTMPNPQRDWDQATKTYRDAYINIAKEYKLPLVDFASEIMPAFSDRVAFEGWYRDGIHFTDEALIKTANHILSEILPVEN